MAAHESSVPSLLFLIIVMIVMMIVVRVYEAGQGGEEADVAGLLVADEKAELLVCGVLR